jgi:uncharacterized membrane protein YccC
MQRATIDKAGAKPNKAAGREPRAGWLRVVPDGFFSLLTGERKGLLIHAGRTALAASLCWWLAQLFGLHDGYWGAISAIIVLQSNVGATIQASRDRILGTIIGAVLGFSCTLFGELPWSYILAVFLAIVVCGLLGFRNSSRLAGVTVTIVMLVQSGSHKSVALDRVIEVFVGIFVAVAVTMLVFPNLERSAARESAGTLPPPGDVRGEEEG